MNRKSIIWTFVFLLISIPAWAVKNPVITTTSLPQGQTTVAYAGGNVNGKWGTKPYTFSIVTGSLPTGLALATVSNVGKITGTPTVVGTFSFKIRLTDSAGTPKTYDQQLYISIIATPVPPSNPVQITTTTPLPDGLVSSPYSTTLQATGGSSPYTWSVTVGTVPAGLALNGATGAITGTPTAPGTVDFTVRVVDSSASPSSAQQNYYIAISNPTPAPAYLFTDGFESGNFSAWSSTPYGVGPYPSCAASGADCGLNRTLVQSITKYAGTYAAQLYYFICSDSTNSSCGAVHQDTGATLEKNFAAGSIPDHFFFRGYFRFHMNAGGTAFGQTVGRKLFYLNPTLANNWHLVLAVTGSQHCLSVTYADSLGTGRGEPSSCVTRTNESIFPSGVGTYSSVAYTNFVEDAWYYMEVEVLLNTLGNADGQIKVWIQKIGTDVSPIQVITTGTNINIRHSYATSLTIFQAGNQADRNNYQKVDEVRYVDNIIVNNAYIGP